MALPDTRRTVEFGSESKQILRELVRAVKAIKPTDHVQNIYYADNKPYAITVAAVQSEETIEKVRQVLQNNRHLFAEDVNGIIVELQGAGILFVDRSNDE